MKHFVLIQLIVLLGAGFVFGGTIVMTTSDYFSGNTAVYDTETGVLRDNVLPHFQDAYVKTDDEFMYILEAGDNSSIIKIYTILDYFWSYYHFTSYHNYDS